MDHKILRLSIGNLIIGLDVPIDIKLDDNFLDFLADECEQADFQCTIREQFFSKYSFTDIWEDREIEIVRSIDLPDFSRCYCDTKSKEKSALCIPVKKGRYSEMIILKPGFVFYNMNQYFRLLGWEQVMVMHGRMILHSSCISTEYGGILFSGVSGIGKSTQADLWQKFRNAELINGDRTILCKEDKWLAYGSPFAGSSHCYKNKCVPIKAIFMLEQGTDNQVYRLSESEAFRLVYAGATVYTWDIDFIERIVTVIGQLVHDVPVYRLVSTPDERAVAAAESVIKEKSRDDENE